MTIVLNLEMENAGRILKSLEKTIVDLQGLVATCPDKVQWADAVALYEGEVAALGAIHQQVFTAIQAAEFPAIILSSGGMGVQS